MFQNLVTVIKQCLRTSHSDVTVLFCYNKKKHRSDLLQMKPYFDTNQPNNDFVTTAYLRKSILYLVLMTFYSTA